jgi:hypothetical protein
VADLETRMSSVENNVADHEKRIAGNEEEIRCIKADCAIEKTALARLDEKLTQALANHADSMKLLKWIVVAALSVIAGLAGIKIVLPGT